MPEKKEVSKTLSNIKSMLADSSAKKNTMALNSDMERRRASALNSVNKLKEAYPEIKNKGVKMLASGEDVWYDNTGGKYNKAYEKEGADFKIAPSDTLPKGKMTTQQWKKEAIGYANKNK
jgi:uncharacterized phage-like protein YoqJ